MSLNDNALGLLRPVSPSVDRKSRSSPSSPAAKRKTKNKLFSSFCAKGKQQNGEESPSPPHSPRTIMKCVKERFGMQKSISPPPKHRHKSTTPPPKENISLEKTTPDISLPEDVFVTQTSISLSSPQPEILVSQTDDEEEPLQLMLAAAPAMTASSRSLLTTEIGFRKDTSRVSMESGYTSDLSQSNLLSRSSLDIKTQEKEEDPSDRDISTQCTNAQNAIESQSITCSCSDAQKKGDSLRRDMHPTRLFTTNVPHDVSIDSPYHPKPDIPQLPPYIPSPTESNVSSTSLSSSPSCSRRGSLASPSCSRRGSLARTPSTTSQRSIVNSYYRVTPKKYLKKSRATSALHLSELMSDDENSVTSTLRKLRVSIHRRNKRHSRDEGNLIRPPELPPKPHHSTPAAVESRGQTDGCVCGAGGFSCNEPSMPRVRYPWSGLPSGTAPSEMTAMSDWFQENVQLLERRMEERIERVKMKMARECGRQWLERRMEKMERECGRLSEHVCDLEAIIPRAYSDSTSTSSIQVSGSMDSLHINVTVPRQEQSQSVSVSPPQRRPSASPSYQSLLSLREESVKSPHELPCQQVNNAVIRHLSQELASWKFPARALGLQEAEIELIRLDNQSDTREQCYKMLQMWMQRYWQNATYQTLGHALQNEAKDVYPKYVDIVSSFVS